MKYIGQTRQSDHACALADRFNAVLLDVSHCVQFVKARKSCVHIAILEYRQKPNHFVVREILHTRLKDLKILLKIYKTTWKNDLITFVEKTPQQSSI